MRELPEGWSIKHLDAVVELKRGFDLPHRSRRDGPYPVLSAGVSAGWHDEGPVRGPGMVVGRATNLGVPTWSDGDFWPLNTTLYAADFKGNHPKFVFHLFESMDLSGFDSGSVQPMLNRNYIAKIKVVLPPVATQRAIAEVLGALDDKIAANRKLIAKCEELSSVNFAQMLEHTTSIPLSRTAEFINGKAFTKGASGTGRVVVRIAELNSGIGGSTVFNDIEVDDKHVARPGDILFAWSGSLTLHRWFRDEAIVNQHIFKVLPAEGYPSWLVHQLIARKLQQFRDIAADKATTMGHIQRRHLDETVDVPVAELIAEHDSLMSGLWQIALTAEQESEVLTVTRDALLPRLMSGELRVRDAARVVEGVL